MSDTDEEISISKAVLLIKKVSRYLLHKWLTIMLIAVAGGLVAFFYAANKKPTYTALLTFVLSSESRVSGLTSLASQLGFASGASGGSDLFAGDNILTLFESRNMTGRTLFKIPPGQHQTLLNIFVKAKELDKEWKKFPATQNAFPFPNDPAKITGVQDSLIREVHASIIAKHLQVGRPNKALSSYTLSVTSVNETFSYYFTNFLMKETASFFIETKTRLAKQNLEMVQKEADSLRRLLGNTITATAASVQRTYNMNPAMQVERAPIQRNQANASFLTNAYSEIAQNVIIAKLDLQKQMPLYQIIDEPTLPLKAVYSNPYLYFFAGFLATAFLTIVVLLVVYFSRGGFN
ncbi:MAG: hypothetical protein M3040_10040 [Bacteroidota bacterium]|nr:hypothetical protein [Bacteroidota bacterium]